MNKKITLATHIFFVVLLLLSTNVLAGSLPDTGQTKCYDNETEINCPQPGESFYGQDANYTINPPSYTKLGYGGVELPDDATDWIMVRDNVTGLIWEVKSDNASSINYKGDTYNWQNAQDVFITSLNSAQFGGFSDWRLPTVKELFFIADKGRYSLAIDTAFFPNTEASHYWSSTTNVLYTSIAWYVDFYYGKVNCSYQSNSLYVRAVRGGQFSNNFIDNGDGTVTDNDTGLMWQQATAPGGYTWEQALSYCEGLVLAEYDDWRLPNFNELQSLVDYGKSWPVIDTAFFPNTEASYFWSSTTYVNGTYRAWYVIFYGGYVYSSLKSGYSYVRAVRGGQCGSFGDSDTDGVCDDGNVSGTAGDNLCTGGNTVFCDDNCPNTPNGPDNGTCTAGDNIGDNCTDNATCGTGGFCSMNQEDSDVDGIGDVCDNCPVDYNPSQTDCDEDWLGDACDLDTIDFDGDGVDDGEGVGHGCDNCPNDYNPGQEDTDEDELGDVCDYCTDTDGDGYGNPGFPNYTCDEDNCPYDANPLQEDTDNDTIGDVCDPCPDDCEQPNILMIMLDDLDVRSLNDLLDASLMPNLKTHIIDKGITFNNYFVQNPVCCPARANFLSGKYSHNNQVVHNAVWVSVPEELASEPTQIMSANDELISITGEETTNGDVIKPVGAIVNFDDTKTFVTLLNETYFTGHMGKYLNGYGTNKYSELYPVFNETYIPPGWDDWQGLIDYTTYRVYNYKFNHNGEIVWYGNSTNQYAPGIPEEYQTDVISIRAQDFIRNRSLSDEPFFLEIMPLVPHTEVGGEQKFIEDYNISFKKMWHYDIRPAPRHENAGVPSFTERGAFNELSLNDKPNFQHENPLINTSNPPSLAECEYYCEGYLCSINPDCTCPGSCDIVFLKRQYENRLRSMLAVDDMIGDLINVLEEEGKLDNTIIVFTSDNGYFFGEHRLTGKVYPYEEAIRVPLYIRVPGIESAQYRDNMVIINDFASTILELANVPYNDNQFDGRSFVSLLSDDDNWIDRKLFLASHGKVFFKFMYRAEIPTYNALRILNEEEDKLYVEWTDKFYHPDYINNPVEYVGLEFYNLTKDPDQRTSEIRIEDGIGAMPDLHDWLADLSNCSGINCHQLEIVN